MGNTTLTTTERTNYGSYLKPNGFNQAKPKPQIMAIPERVQARLDAAQAAFILGFNEHDVPVLVRNGLLQPLGDDVAQNSRKYFAAIEIMALAVNRAWLSDATQVVSQNWNAKNASRKNNKLLVDA